MNLSWLTDVFVKVGIWEGLFILFFFIAHKVLFSLYNERLEDRQREIDRLAKENHEYRNKFMKLVEANLKSTTTD